MKILLLLICITLVTCSAYSLSLYDISNDITKDCSTVEQKVVALREAVYNRMKPNGNGYSLKDVKNHSLEWAWEHGVGWCDHQASVFMLLAREQGIRTRLIYLLTENMGKSEHTIAEALIDNRWVVVDVGNNIEYRYYNRLATRNDMAIDFDGIVWEKVKDLGQPKEYWKMFIYKSYLIREMNP